MGQGMLPEGIDNGKDLPLKQKPCLQSTGIREVKQESLGYKSVQDAEVLIWVETDNSIFKALF